MINFAIEENQIDCTYTHNNSRISISAFKEKMAIFFYAHEEDGYDLLYQVKDTCLFSDFAESAIEWIFYQCMTENNKWNDNGILEYDCDPICFTKGNWSLVFSDFRLPSFDFSDENSTLTFQIDYNTLPLFLEWASNLRNFL